MPFPEMRTLPMFAFLADIKTFYRSVVTHDACVDETFAAALLILLQNRQAFLIFSAHINSNF